MMDDMQDDLSEFDVTRDEFDAMLAEGEPVEIGGPPEGGRRATIHLLRNTSGEFFWRLVAPSGQLLATSGETYRSRDDLRRAIDLLTMLIRTASIVESWSSGNRKGK